MESERGGREATAAPVDDAAVPAPTRSAVEALAASMLSWSLARWEPSVGAFDVIAAFPNLGGGRSYCRARPFYGMGSLGRIARYKLLACVL
jgi:hypothetical protein